MIESNLHNGTNTSAVETAPSGDTTNTKRRALITGITGQDGSYLAEFLLGRGYTVAGLVRRHSEPRFQRITHLLERLELIAGDVTDASAVLRAVDSFRPTEIYNLAAQSSVPESWRQPYLTGQVTGLGVMHLLEAIRNVDPSIRFYQASSSEMFGNAPQSPQHERTPFRPRSPYGAAKVYAHHLTVNYRESYDLYAACGILFNHESPRRGIEFVTRKVTQAAAKIKLGHETRLAMGNLDAERDWGYAGDYVRAMHLILQNPDPDDFVVATGQSHSVRELLEIAFRHVGLDWQDHVVTDARFLRATDVDCLVGDAAKACETLGWTPRLGFGRMIEGMVDYDLALLAPDQGDPLKLQRLEDLAAC